MALPRRAAQLVQMCEWAVIFGDTAERGIKVGALVTRAVHTFHREEAAGGDGDTVQVEFLVPRNRRRIRRRLRLERVRLHLNLVDLHAVLINLLLKVVELRLEGANLSREFGVRIVRLGSDAAGREQRDKRGAAQKVAAEAAEPTRNSGRARSGRQRGRVVASYDVFHWIPPRRSTSQFLTVSSFQPFSWLLARGWTFVTVQRRFLKNIFNIASVNPDKFLF